MDLSIRITQRSFRRSGATALRVVFGWPARVLAARRAMLQLAEMSAHELKDIGLVPADLNDVTALSLDADPTDLLARRARERRRTR